MTDKPERLRLFVAAAVPVDVLEALHRTVEPYGDRVAGARWAPLENQHLTLKFLGHVPVARQDEIVAACHSAAAAAVPAEVSVSGLGAFPSPRRARVLWAGLDDPSDVLGTSARALDERFGPLGFEAEKRAFTPHLTLAQFKIPGDVRPVLDAVDFSSAPFPVTNFRLYRSRLSPKGARYEVLETFVLHQDH